jgi:hypothetical protein
MSKKTALVIVNKNDNQTGIVKPVDDNIVTIEWENNENETLTTEDFDALIAGEEYVLEEVELDEDESPAQGTIKAHGSADVAPGSEGDGNPKTRLDMIRAILGGLADVDTQTLTKYFNDQQALVGGEAARAGIGDNAAKNAASIQMHPSAAMESVIPKLQKNEQDAIFAESTLTEDAKKKMTTLFETAVISRVTEEAVKLQETYETKLDETITSLTESLIEQIDTYVTHVASEWVKENEVAIESSLRNELVSEFLEKLHGLFVENYIDVPEEKVSVIEKLVKENEELNATLNKKINEDIETQKLIKTFKKNEIINTFSEGLTLPQKDKLKKLSETIEFETEESFKEKLAIVKEGFVREKNNDSNIVSESLVSETPTKTTNSEDVRINRMAEVLKNAKL